MLCRDEDREIPIQALVNEGSIVEVGKEMVLFKKALVANDIIAKIQKEVVAKSADKSPDFKFNMGSSELLPETEAKFDLLAGRCHVPCPFQLQSHYLLHRPTSSWPYNLLLPCCRSDKQGFGGEGRRGCRVEVGSALSRYTGNCTKKIRGGTQVPHGQR
jgi:hypothetical protein